jgi:hypothetical protein
MSTIAVGRPTTSVGLTVKGFGIRSVIALVAAIVFVVAGSVVCVMGFQAKGQVADTLRAEHITLTPDAPQLVGMKGGTVVDSASTAHAMAQIIRHHTLESTDGLVYADMGRFLDKNGKPTGDASKAAIDPKTKQPVENLARNIWVTSTTWRSALMQAEMGFKLADFVSGVGALFVLVGLGFAAVGIKRTKSAPEA